MAERRNRRHFPRLSCRGIVCLSALASILAAPQKAQAGGFFIPDLGTEALGRGATFTAKADDGTAFIYNVAGFARQRGTRLTLDLNIPFNSFTFTRTGKFPDKASDDTPWGGKPFPTVRNTAGPGVLPLLIVSSDLGMFDRLTFAAGVYPPSAIAGSTFPLGVEKAPAASRYDSVQGKGLIIYPSLGAAYRVLPWLDVGAAVHLVYGSFDQVTLSYADQMAGQCATVEDYRCDARSNIVAKGMGFTGSLGVMARPKPEWQFGLNLLGPSTVKASGTAAATPPPITPNLMIKPGTAELEVKFPWVVRAGARYIQMDGKFELWDLEADLTLEGWGGAQTPGPTATISNLGTYDTINAVSSHYYKNTLSLRLGGAYNFEELDGLFALRGGMFYDSTASEPEYTRLDFDTLAKIGATLGIGYKHGGVKVDFGYAAIASVPRHVEKGRVQPINGTKGGKPVDASGNPLPVVNNGDFAGFTHLISLGTTITFDAFFGGVKKPTFGDPDVEDLAGKEPPKKPGDGEEKKDEKKEEKPAAKPGEKPGEKPGQKTPETTPPTNPTSPSGCKWGEC